MHKYAQSPLPTSRSSNLTLASTVQKSAALVHPKECTKMHNRPPAISQRFVYPAILLAVLAAYWPALTGGFVWDDSAHVTKSSLQSFHGLWRIWTDLGATQQYYPLLHSAFWLEHRLWGDAVLGYHLVNLAQHT